MNRKVLYKINYGMYVIGSKKDNRINGQIANTVFQIASDPDIIAISINKENLTHEYIQASKLFTISIIVENTDMQFIGTFGFKSGRDIDKFENIKYKLTEDGLPVLLEHSAGYLECEVIDSIDTHSHTLFIGKMINADVLNNDNPMTYAYYHKVKKGVSPKTAPTYIKEEIKKEDDKMKKYKCTVCGYIYDPEKGDPDSGIEPGTKFEDIPDDWVCPVCGVSKDDFEEI